MRAVNMQAMTDDVKRKFPGVVVYGIGNEAHQGEVSGHNEDDTPGVRAELQDADTKREHRAIDIMIGPAFSKADADALVASILRDPAARSRLYYIIWYGWIWSRSSGWVAKNYNGSDQHTNHVHLSGWAADDDNAAGWPAVGGVDMTEMFPRYGEEHDGVAYVQFQLENLGYDVGTVDGGYGDKTAVALAKFVKGYNGNVVDGKRVTPAIRIYLDAAWSRKFGGGTPGPRGPAGPAGAPGAPGKLPAAIRLTGTATVEEATS